MLIEAGVHTCRVRWRVTWLSRVWGLTKMWRRVRALMRRGRLLMSTNWMPSAAARRSCPSAAVSSRGAVWGMSVRLHRIPCRPAGQIFECVHHFQHPWPGNAQRQ